MRIIKRKLLRIIMRIMIMIILIILRKQGIIILTIIICE